MAGLAGERFLSLCSNRFDRLEYAFVREKPEFVEGNRFYNLLKKGQCVADGIWKIKRREAAAEEAGSALRSTLGYKFVLGTLLQEVNVSQRSRSGKGKSTFPMPGSSVHPDLASILSEDDPIIAEDADARLPVPDSCCGCFPRTRLACKEMAIPL